LKANTLCNQWQPFFKLMRKSLKEWYAVFIKEALLLNYLFTWRESCHQPCGPERLPRSPGSRNRAAPVQVFRIVVLAAQDAADLDAGNV
jgi:hypothetical protein